MVTASLPAFRPSCSAANIAQLPCVTTATNFSLENIDWAKLFGEMWTHRVAPVHANHVQIECFIVGGGEGVGEGRLAVQRHGDLHTLRPQLQAALDPTRTSRMMEERMSGLILRQENGTTGLGDYEKGNGCL